MLLALVSHNTRWRWCETECPTNANGMAFKLRLQNGNKNFFVHYCMYYPSYWHQGYHATRVLTIFDLYTHSPWLHQAAYLDFGQTNQANYFHLCYNYYLFYHFTNIMSDRRSVRDCFIRQMCLMLAKHNLLGIEQQEGYILAVQ